MCGQQEDSFENIRNKYVKEIAKGRKIYKRQ
jgi:hypothetical protein